MKSHSGKCIVDFAFGWAFWGLLLLPGLAYLRWYEYVAASLAGGVAVLILGDRFWDRIRFWSWFRL